MILLFNSMDLITPDFGLVFWTTVVFLIFWIFIGKKLISAIVKAIQQREDSIENSLQAAERAKSEMQQLSNDNAIAIKRAQEEASLILKEARDLKAQIETNAQAKAKEDAAKIIAEAKVEIDKQKQSAMLEVKQEISKLAVGIAEKVLAKELDTSKDQQSLINHLVDQININ
jgi:F-type H+-transporting ATPase subunit b